MPEDSFTELVCFCWDLGAKMLMFLNEMNFLARTGQPLPVMEQ